jgi:hypothetical protein
MTGLCLLNCPSPLQPQPTRKLQCRHQLRYEWEPVAVVRLAAATILVHIMPDWHPTKHIAAYRSIPGFRQDVRAGRSHSQQRNTAGRGAYVLLFRQQQCPPVPLHLPRQECPRQRVHDPLLRGRQRSTYDPACLCLQRTGGSWGSCGGHEA